ncbi:unnamed protein product [Symbiodinium natans]|uniref:Vesicle transport protein n=1 Tax=Symbiodinium natans TaxID=878477 RepID=A0A812IA30_9DINO|nr:unnamed protein product [Symbiodinium natans]
MSRWWPFNRSQEASDNDNGSQAGAGSASARSWRSWLPTAAGAPEVESQPSGVSLPSLRSIGGISMNEAEEALTANSDVMCPHMTIKQRIIGWLSCLALGLLLEFSGMGRGVHAVVGGEKAAERFAILYSVGNLIALIGTFFLAGPMRLQRSAECRTQVPEFSLRDGKCRQLRRMGREHRWVVSLCFLVSMVLTLVVARLSLFWLGEAWGEAPELFGECNSGSKVQTVKLRAALRFGTRALAATCKVRCADKTIDCRMPTIDMPVETLCKSPCERGFPTSRWDVARRWQPCVVAGAAALGSEENRRWVSVEWLPGLNASCKFLQFAGNVDVLGHTFKRAVQESREEALDKQEAKLSLFCFAWTPRREYDEKMLVETRKQYRKCDGHIFYTDHAAPGPQKEADFMRVVVPPQSVGRDDDNWLYHRNMVGLMPSWNHLIHSNFVQEHDWFINSELDHFLSPARARETIAEYLKGLREGSPQDQAGAFLLCLFPSFWSTGAHPRSPVIAFLAFRLRSLSSKATLDGPIMLMWGNAFVSIPSSEPAPAAVGHSFILPHASHAFHEVFNRKFLLVVKQHWGKIGRVGSSVLNNSDVCQKHSARDAPPDQEALVTRQQLLAVQCSQLRFMDDTSEWPRSCSQDVVYPHLAAAILPKQLGVTVANPGSAGCGAGSVNGKHKAYPLGCWELHLNPISGGKEGALKAIKELAEMRRFKDPKQATAYCQRHQLDAVRNNCMRFWDGRNVPLIHHLHTVSEQQLARQLLDNDSSP